MSEESNIFDIFEAQQGKRISTSSVNIEKSLGKKSGSSSKELLGTASIPLRDGKTKYQFICFLCTRHNNSMI